MTALDLTPEALRAMVEAATPGPWAVMHPEHHFGMIEVCGPRITCWGFTRATDVDEAKRSLIQGDARLIAAAPTVALALADAKEEIARLREVLLDGSRPLPFTREDAGRMVREAWVRWAETQPNPKASWLVPYHQLDDADKEADRQIGETVARWTLVFDAGRAALTATAPTEYERKVAQMKEDFPNGI